MLELIPKSELPEWNEEDDKRMNDFKERLNSGQLHLMGGRFD